MQINSLKPQVKQGFQDDWQHHILKWSMCFRGAQLRLSRYQSLKLQYNTSIKTTIVNTFFNAMSKRMKSLR